MYPSFNEQTVKYFMPSPALLPDAEIESRFEAIGAGVSVRDIRFTRDTIADWLVLRQAWVERGRLVRGPEGTLVIEYARPRPEDPLMSVYIVDFGEVRGVYAY